MAKKKNRTGNGNVNQTENGNEPNITRQAGGGEQKKPESIKAKSIDLKIDIHCEGCAAKMTKIARSFQGVDSVTADVKSGKLRVEGLVDSIKFLEFMAAKTKKKVDLISQSKAQNNNASGGGQNTINQKSNDKEVRAKTTIIKMDLHCQGCIDKIRKIALKTKGVEDVSFDRQKDTVTANGTMEVKALVDALREKFKRTVEIVPQKFEKKEGENTAEKKKKGNDAQKQNNGGGGGAGGDKKVTVGENRLELMAQPGTGPGHGFINPPSYGSALVNPRPSYGPGFVNPRPNYGSGFVDPPSYGSGFVNPPSYGSGFVNPPSYAPSYGGPPAYSLIPGFGGPPLFASASTLPPMGGGHMGPPAFYSQDNRQDYGYGHTTPGYPAHMKFSDENPNACSVM